MKDKMFKLLEKIFYKESRDIPMTDAEFQAQEKSEKQKMYRFMDHAIMCLMFLTSVVIIFATITYNNFSIIGVLVGVLVSVSLSLVTCVLLWLLRKYYAFGDDVDTWKHTIAWTAYHILELLAFLQYFIFLLYVYACVVSPDNSQNSNLTKIHL